jgi:hypothetical protein
MTSPRGPAIDLRLYQVDIKVEFELSSGDPGTREDPLRSEANRKDCALGKINELLLNIFDVKERYNTKYTDNRS